ncbi:PI-PLC X domain-containing protein At5g67130-like [Rhododendron vialii]|uniref:PI-PLC X domain-containing protein At5g67130-like n=1 Tax=Rhododendron vialii TaxID=182163 RepID=UPI0026604CA0|nr:PI-PLC X domain-containing protein At5g67130-like [Rhododendron vialii]
MGGLICNIILIVLSVFHYVILPANALSHHEQRQIEGESRSSSSDPFKIVNNALPFNKYAFLTTHDAHASTAFQYTVKGGRYQIGTASKDSVTQQLNSGVRALMLNVFNKTEDVWLCQKCDKHDEYPNDKSPALGLFQEVEEFLTSNPSEVVTLFLKDEVETPNGLAKLFDATGLTKYMLPLSKMPRYGGDWPRVRDMVAANQRLVVFSSAKTKEESEGIGYQGNFVVEYQYGSQGMDPWMCAKRDGLSPLEKKSKSLVLLNYLLPPRGFRRYGEKISKDLMLNAIRLCRTIDSHNWANFIDVDYDRGIDVGPAFQAVDFLNGKLLCGCDDVNSCRGGSWCPPEAGFGIRTKVIALLITCIVLGCASCILRYIKKQKYKLKK